MRDKSNSVGPSVCERNRYRNGDEGEETTIIDTRTWISVVATRPSGCPAEREPALSPAVLHPAGSLATASPPQSTAVQIRPRTWPR